MRRYDVDWLRICALGLLILYHVVVGFQPWAAALLFIQNDQTLETLWILMGMLNVWRIPILFVVSGMGVCFAMEKRDWKALLKDRTLRILTPFIFGFFFICPISTYIAIKYYGGEAGYFPNPGHLWFLANIFLYVAMLLPLLLYLKSRPNHIVLGFLSRFFRYPGGLYVLAIPVVVEALLVQPEVFSTYVGTSHGFWLGLVCFSTGFLFVSLKDFSWPAAERLRGAALALAFFLYLARLLAFGLEGPIALTALESVSWILAILGYGSAYLNQPSQTLAYFSKAVYPVYIVHFPVQCFFSYYLMPLPLPSVVKLLTLLATTLGASLLLYELVIKRLKWIRPLFGMKFQTS